MDAACADDLNEPNDSLLAGNPIASGAFPAVLCSADEDWFRIAPDDVGELHVMMNPQDGRLLTLEVWDSSGGAPLPGASASSADNPVTIDVPGPLADPYYWLRIVGSSPTTEGQYCLDTRFVAGNTCSGAGGEPI
jgi:hypothetical protein